MMPCPGKEIFKPGYFRIREAVVGSVYLVKTRKRGVLVWLHCNT